jgi:hypothetical protein
MASDGNFSILEAVHPGGQPFQTRKPLPGDLEKQVVTENGLQVATVDGIEVTPIVEYVKENLAPQQHTKLSQRKWLIIGGVVGLIVILAAVLGGTLAHKRKSNSKTPSSLGPTSNPVNPCSTPVSVQYQRNIAALSYISNNANRTKVYYQATWAN